MNLKYLILPVIIISILTSNLAMACICAKLGDNFFDTVNQHNIKVGNGEYPATEALTVFTGKVIKYEDAPLGSIPGSMLVKVNQVMQGSVTTKNILIQGDVDGMQCRPPVINFPINTNYIFAANQDENNKYYISGCGYYYLETTSPSSV